MASDEEEFEHKVDAWTVGQLRAALELLRKSAPLIVAAELERMADTPPEDGPWWALASSLRKHAADYRSMNPPGRKDGSNEPR